VALDGRTATTTIGVPRHLLLPHEFVVELPALTTFESFAVPELGEFGPAKGKHVKTVEIEGSTESAEAGFSPLIRFQIESSTGVSGGFAILYGIHFDEDSDVLRPDAKPALEQILAALKDLPEINVVIEGHTDSDGSDAHNLDLSDRRAKSVVAWLTERQIAAGRLTPRGKGESEPISSNDSPVGKGMNRRVEVEAR